MVTDVCIVETEEGMIQSNGLIAVTGMTCECSWENIDSSEEPINRPCHFISGHLGNVIEPITLWAVANLFLQISVAISVALLFVLNIKPGMELSLYTSISRVLSCQFCYV